ncbi:P1 family peptidase [Janibacter melonis]|uniref:P1 family peptidase n=1 Tax=Janibacter melonis TaxID=262209 RepID=UPI0027DA4883|nr:P1 family peptidase [Janibacter melonis]
MAGRPRPRRGRADRSRRHRLRPRPRGRVGSSPGAAEGRAAYDAATTGPVDEGSSAPAPGPRRGLKGGWARRAPSSPTARPWPLSSSSTPSAPRRPRRPAPRRAPARAAGGGRAPEPDPARVDAYWAALEQEQTALRAGTATTIAVVATDARLSKPATSMLARVAHDGMARAISPVHTVFDGDTVFALATGEGLPSPLDLVALQTEAARCVTRAIVSAMLAATSVDRSADGGALLRSYRDALVG